MYDTDDAVKKLGWATVAMLIVFAIGVGGYVVIGRGEWSLLDCAYMTVITLATVGYGEVIPIAGNPLARIFTMALILFGMGAILFFVSSMTAFIVEGQLQNILRRKRMSRLISEMREHIILCGVGETGLHIAEELRHTDTDFVMIDLDEIRLHHVSEMLGGNIPFVVGDASEDETLKAAGIDRARGVISACTNDKDNLFITVTARQLNPQVRIVAKSVGMSAESKLRKAGADATVTTNYIGGLRMASEMLRPAVVTFLDRMMRDKTKRLRIDEVDIAEGSKLSGRNLADLDLHRRIQVAIIAIRKKSEDEFIYNPGGNFQLDSGMCLVCMGEIESIDKLREMARA